MSVNFDLPILVQFPSDPCFIFWHPWSLHRNISSFSASGFVCLWPLIARSVREWGGRGRGATGGEELFADFRVKLFWCMIYCANKRPNAWSQSGYWSLRGLVSRAPWIMCEYDLAAAIVIRALIQPYTCKMGSSIFASMGGIKLESTKKESLPSMPSTERMNGEQCFHCLW